MCFSATVSFTAALVLSVVGVATVRKARFSKWLPLAMSPIFFSIQQVLEGMIWVTLGSNDHSSVIHQMSVYGYLIFASMFWPVWIPFVFYNLEEKGFRQKILLSILLLGLSISTISLVSLLNNEMLAEMNIGHISYLFKDNVWEQYHYVIQLLWSMYFVCTVLPFFISKIHKAWIIGFLVGVAYYWADFFYTASFSSIWCFSAAIASVLVYYIIHREGRVANSP